MGKIHDEAANAYFSERPNHRALVQRFLPDFDVTRAKRRSDFQAYEACTKHDRAARLLCLGDDRA